MVQIFLPYFGPIQHGGGGDGMQRFFLHGRQQWNFEVGLDGWPYG